MKKREIGAINKRTAIKKGDIIIEKDGVYYNDSNGEFRNCPICNAHNSVSQVESTYGRYGLKSNSKYMCSVCLNVMIVNFQKGTVVKADITEKGVCYNTGEIVASAELKLFDKYNKNKCNK